MPTIKAVKSSSEEKDGVFAGSAAVSELPDPEHMQTLAQVCTGALEEACNEQVDILLFPSIPYADQNSVMFQAVSVQYKAMREFQASHPYPEEIRILCKDDRVLNMYMVVWNLYYAEDKASRMNDGRWD